MRVPAVDTDAPQGDSMPYVGVRPQPGAVSVTPATPAAGVVLVTFRNPNSIACHPSISAT